MVFSPITKRRIDQFKANKRGYWSLWIFAVLFIVTLAAELVANDKPIYIHYDGKNYLPMIYNYPETMFGGDFETEAEYRDEFVSDMINEKGYMICGDKSCFSNTLNIDELNSLIKNSL